MRFLMRNELDMSKSVNLRQLSPAMKVYAGALSKWRETNYYKSKLNERLEAAHAVSVKKDEHLKEAMLVNIYRELDCNESLVARGEECTEVVLCIKSNYIYSLDRILKHKDFLPYEVEKVEEDEDIRVAFPDMPILVRVRKKLLQGVE